MLTVIDVRSGLFIPGGVPEHVGSDNRPKSVATAPRKWLAIAGATTAYIAPGSPW
jgi:putative transposase